jgi:hypothetical protein
MYPSGRLNKLVVTQWTTVWFWNNALTSDRVWSISPTSLKLMFWCEMVIWKVSVLISQPPHLRTLKCGHLTVPVQNRQWLVCNKLCCDYLPVKVMILAWPTCRININLYIIVKTETGPINVNTITNPVRQITKPTSPSCTVAIFLKPYLCSEFPKIRHFREVIYSRKYK